MADDGTLAKMLFVDITRQPRLTAGQGSVDSKHRYDSVAHTIV